MNELLRKVTLTLIIFILLYICLKNLSTINRIVEPKKKSKKKKDKEKEIIYGELKNYTEYGYLKHWEALDAKASGVWKKYHKSSESRKNDQIWKNAYARMTKMKDSNNFFIEKRNAFNTSMDNLKKKRLDVKSKAYYSKIYNYYTLINESPHDINAESTKLKNARNDVYDKWNKSGTPNTTSYLYAIMRWNGQVPGYPRVESGGVGYNTAHLIAENNAVNEVINELGVRADYAAASGAVKTYVSKLENLKTKLNDFKYYYEDYVVKSHNTSLETYLDHLNNVEDARDSLISYIEPLNYKINDINTIKAKISNFPNITNSTDEYTQIHEDSPCYYNFSLNNSKIQCTSDDTIKSCTSRYKNFINELVTSHIVYSYTKNINILNKDGHNDTDIKNRITRWIKLLETDYTGDLIVKEKKQTIVNNLKCMRDSIVSGNDDCGDSKPLTSHDILGISDEEKKTCSSSTFLGSTFLEGFTEGYKASNCNNIVSDLKNSQIQVLLKGWDSQDLHDDDRMTDDNALSNARNAVECKEDQMVNNAKGAIDSAKKGLNIPTQISFTSKIGEGSVFNKAIEILDNSITSAETVNTATAYKNVDGDVIKNAKSYSTKAKTYKTRNNKGYNLISDMNTNKKKKGWINCDSSTGSVSGNALTSKKNINDYMNQLNNDQLSATDNYAYLKSSYGNLVTEINNETAICGIEVILNNYNVNIGNIINSGGKEVFPISKNNLTKLKSEISNADYYMSKTIQNHTSNLKTTLNTLLQTAETRISKSEFYHLLQDSILVNTPTYTKNNYTNYNCHSMTKGDTICFISSSNTFFNYPSQEMSTANYKQRLENNESLWNNKNPTLNEPNINGNSLFRHVFKINDNESNKTLFHGDTIYLKNKFISDSIKITELKHSWRNDLDFTDLPIIYSKDFTYSFKYDNKEYNNYRIVCLNKIDKGQLNDPTNYCDDQPAFLKDVNA